MLLCQYWEVIRDFNSVGRSYFAKKHNENNSGNRIEKYLSHTRCWPHFLFSGPPAHAQIQRNSAVRNRYGSFMTRQTAPDDSLESTSEAPGMFSLLYIILRLQDLCGTSVEALWVKYNLIWDECVRACRLTRVQLAKLLLLARPEDEEVSPSSSAPCVLWND